MPKINLFINKFESKDIERQKELDFCFNKNEKSGFFDRIINFSERPTYSDFFKQTKKYPEDINILANLDILFNESILNVKNLTKNEAYAITRWEVDEATNEIILFEQKHAYNREAKAKYSQDIWVFNGYADGIFGEFYLGIPGCDNRIAYEIIQAGYQLSNQRNKIICVHVHADEKRNYNIPKNSPPKVSPPYRWVEPAGDQSEKKTIF